MKQEVRRHNERLSPPCDILAELGGPKEVIRLYEEAVKDSARRQLEVALAQEFRKAHLVGKELGRWNSIREMASALKVHVSTAKRLVNGDVAYLESMKIGEIYLYAAKLQITLGAPVPGPREIVTAVAQSIVHHLRTGRRKAGEAVEWLSPQPGEVREILDLARRVGYVEDASLRRQDRWETWLEELSRQAGAGGGQEELRRLVGVGDWMAAYPYLPLFEHHLYRDLVERLKVAESSEDEDEARQLKSFLLLLAEVKRLLRAFDDSPNRTVEEVARKLKLNRPEAVAFHLSTVGLKVENFRGEEAVLGRLVMLSSVLRPLYKELFKGEGGG